VFGLILLLVLTLLAVTGINSASTELIMAGNEQYRQSEFRAAETGIDLGMQNGAMVPGAAVVNLAGAKPGGETYTYSITSLVGLTAEPPPSLNADSRGLFNLYQFQIQSTGASVRGAQSTHLQGAQIRGPRDPGEFGDLGGAGAGALGLN
jgi:Tfp pilus assembly protein PilX